MKQILLLPVLFLAIYTPLSAQNMVNIQAQSGGDQLKNVSQGRSIALTNTVMAMATGVAAVSLFSNNTIETTGAALTVYGIVMGPSTGNFYAEDYSRGLVGAAGRAAGAFLMADATREVFGHSFADALQIDDQEVSLTDTKMLIGGSLVVASAVYNLLSIKQSVNNYNARWGLSMNVASAGFSHTLTPMLTARYNF